MRRAEKLRGTSVYQIYRSCELPNGFDGEHPVNFEVSLTIVGCISPEGITEISNGLPTEIAILRSVLNLCPWLDNVILPGSSGPQQTTVRSMWDSSLARQDEWRRSAADAIGLSWEKPRSEISIAAHAFVAIVQTSANEGQYSVVDVLLRIADDRCKRASSQPISSVKHELLSFVVDLSRSLTVLPRTCARFMK